LLWYIILKTFDSGLRT